MVGSNQVAVGTSTAVVLAGVPAEAVNIGPAATVWLLPDATNDVYLGGVGVTTSTGCKLTHGTALVGPFTLFAGDTLYAIASGGSATVGVLQT